MSNIFALKGKANSGKTETVKTIFHNLQAKYPTATVNVLISNTVDIKVIMDINGTKVGIESQGDPHPRLKQSLSDFVNAKCDIIICTTRTRGMTVEWVNSYKKQYNIRFIQQSYVQSISQSVTNNATANQIISMTGL